MLRERTRLCRTRSPFPHSRLLFGQVILWETRSINCANQDASERLECSLDPIAVQGL